MVKGRNWTAEIISSTANPEQVRRVRGAVSEERQNLKAVTAQLAVELHIEIAAKFFLY